MNTVAPTPFNLNTLSVLQLKILARAISAADAGKVGIYPDGGPMHRAFYKLRELGLLDFQGYSLIRGEKVSIFSVTDTGRTVFADATPMAFDADAAPEAFSAGDDVPEGDTIGETQKAATGATSASKHGSGSYTRTSELPPGVVRRRTGTG